VIFSYRPCRNLCSHLRSVYTQHRHYFDLINCYICPQEAFLLDLAQVITEWAQMGDEILLFADLNRDIRHQDISSFATSCGLVEGILSRFPSLPSPATFKRGNHLGRSPIDGAWATPGVNIRQAMMCAIQHSPGDHRAIIHNINLLDTIGKPRFLIPRPPAQRLCCSIPSSSE